MYNRNCLVCNKEFIAANFFSKYCSRACYLTIHKVKYTTFKCQQCGKEVNIPASQATNSKKYCSKECYGIASRGIGHNYKYTKYTEEERRQRLSSRSIQWQKKNPFKAYVQGITRLNNDLLTIIYECRCAHNKKQYHHFDYTRMFEVIKLFPNCHAAEHKRLSSLTASVVDDSSIPERLNQKRSISKDATISLYKGSVPAVGEASADQSPASS